VRVGRGRLWRREDEQTVGDSGVGRRRSEEQKERCGVVREAETGKMMTANNGMANGSGANKRTMKMAATLRQTGDGRSGETAWRRQCRAAGDNRKMA